MNNSGPSRKRGWFSEEDDLRFELKRRKTANERPENKAPPVFGAPAASGAKCLAYNRMQRLRSQLEEQRLKGIPTAKPKSVPSGYKEVGEAAPCSSAKTVIETPAIAAPRQKAKVKLRRTYDADKVKWEPPPPLLPGNDKTVERKQPSPPQVKWKPSPPQVKWEPPPQLRADDRKPHVPKWEPPENVNKWEPSFASKVPSSSMQERLKACRNAKPVQARAVRSMPATDTGQLYFTPPPKCREVPVELPAFRRYSEPSRIESHPSPLHILTKESNNNDEGKTSSSVAEEEAMEWAPINEDELVSDIKVVRETLAAQFVKAPVMKPPLPLPATPKRPSPTSSELYVVVDTNVFIHRLPVVGNIINITFEDKTSPIVYVPWMVFQELDYIKDGYSKATKENSSRVKDECVRAIQFIHKCLMSQRNNLKTESAHEATRNQFRLTVPDDYILSSCLNLMEQKKQVILLSADMHLRSKALVNNLRAFHPNDVMKELKQMGRPKKSDKVEKVSEALSGPLTAILFAVTTAPMRADPLFAKIPMPFGSCLKFMKSRFDDVLRDNVHKHCQKVIDELLELQSNECSDENNFINSCFALMMYLKTGFPKYESPLTFAIKEIEDIVQKS